MCIEHSTCRGLIFYFDQDRFKFEKLFFLKDIIELLLVSCKQIDLIGIPVCVIRTLLGGYLYMRFINNQIDRNSITDCREETIKNFLPICKFCMDRNKCPTYSNIDFEKIRPVVKKYLSSTPINLLKPFDVDCVTLNSMHEAYIKYCQKKESFVTYRTVYYVSNIDFKSEYSYTNRFIYGCDYISPDEYAEEFAFLREHVLHKEYIDLLESIASIEKTSQIAYSLAQKDTTLRESFYMFVSKEYGDAILKDFSVHYRYPKSFNLQFIGIGIDVISSKVESYKLYFQSTKNFLKSYLEPYGIDISQLTHNSHYLALRLDKNQHFISYKVEILIIHEDLKYFKEVIDNYDYYDEKLKRKGLYNIAIEIVEEQISKINIYHRYCFMEKIDNDI
jgi:hypothetical protein